MKQSINIIKPIVSRSISDNRVLFLEELRSGKHSKGTIKSDAKGIPIIENEEDDLGKCNCAIMGEMFGVTHKGTISLSKAVKALGLTTKECSYIQHHINDKPTTLAEDADRIEQEVFNNNGGLMYVMKSAGYGEDLTPKEKKIKTEYVKKAMKALRNSGQIIHI